MQIILNYLLNWMGQSQEKFTSPEIQNKILSIMAQYTNREIASEVVGTRFTIVVDETTDLSYISNTEQRCFFCLRCNDSLEIHAEFIKSLDSTSAGSIVYTFKDILLCMNLRIENCCGYVTTALATYRKRSQCC